MKSQSDQEYMQEALRLLGLSQRGLADKAGINRNTVGRIANGKAHLSRSDWLNIEALKAQLSPKPWLANPDDLEIRRQWIRAEAKKRLALSYDERRRPYYDAAHVLDVAHDLMNEAEVVCRFTCDAIAASEPVLVARNGWEWVHQFVTIEVWLEFGGKNKRFPYVGCNPGPSINPVQAAITSAKKGWFLHWLDIATPHQQPAIQEQPEKTNGRASAETLRKYRELRTKYHGGDDTLAQLWTVKTGEPPNLEEQTEEFVKHLHSIGLKLHEAKDKS